MKSEAALAIAPKVPSQSVTDRVNWTLSRLQTEIAACSTLTISKSRLSKTLKKGVHWRRPHHCLNERQDPEAVDRSGLPAPGEAPTCGYRPLGQARKLVLLGVSDYVIAKLTVHTSSTKRSTDFVALLELIDRRYGPQSGRIAIPVVLVLGRLSQVPLSRGFQQRRR